MSTVSLIFLFAWHLGLSTILNLPPSTWPIPYVSALCLFLSGLAIFALFSSYRFPLSNLLGVAIFLLGFQRTSELLFSADSKWNLLLSSVHIHPENSSKMVITAAIGFMLVGILFMLWSKTKRTISKNIILLSVATVIIFLGTIGIFIHLLPIQIDHELDRFLIHFYTAFGLFFIGLAFIVNKFHENSIKQDSIS